MEQITLQEHITKWLDKNYAANQHTTILTHVLTVGKKSKPWVESIQRYVKEKTYHTLARGEIKRACRTLLERVDT